MDDFYFIFFFKKKDPPRIKPKNGLNDVLYESHNIVTTMSQYFCDIGPAMSQKTATLVGPDTIQQI